MLGNKPPYTTMQQLNLDWILSKLKTLLRLVPDDGAVGQILRRTRDGAVWSDEQGGGGGAVESVNGQTGAVVLDAADVGALPDDYTPPVTSVNGQTGAVSFPYVSGIRADNQSGGGVTQHTGVISLVGNGCQVLSEYLGRIQIAVSKVSIGLGLVANERQYSANNPPPYPVTSVNGQTGAVVLDVADVGALPNTIPYVVENGVSGVWRWTRYSDNTVDLYLNATVQIENYSSVSTNGLYLYTAAFPFAITTSYTIVAGGKVGNGLSIVALTNPLSGTQMSIVLQSNLTGLQNCIFQAHVHGVKA